MKGGVAMRILMGSGDGNASGGDSGGCSLCSDCVLFIGFVLNDSSCLVAVLLFQEIGGKS